MFALTRGHTFLRAFYALCVIFFISVLFYSGASAQTKAVQKKRIDSLLSALGDENSMDERIKTIEQVENTSRKLGYAHGLMNSNNQYGIVYYHKGEYSRSDMYFQKYFEYAVRLNDTSSIVQALNNRASIKLTMGYKEEALKLFQRATEYLTPRTTREYNTVWYNIAMIYKDLKSYNKAIAVLRRIFADTQAEMSTRIKSCNIMGMVYTSKQNYDSAYYFLKAGLRLNKDAKSVLDQSELLNTLGSVFVQTKKLDSAIACFDEALKIAVENNLKDNELVYRMNIAEQLMAQKKFAVANKLLADMKSDFMKSEDMQSRSYYLFMLAVSYEEVGKYKESVDAFMLYSTTKDFLDSINNLTLSDNFDYNLNSRLESIRDSLKNVRERESNRVTMVKQEETIKRGRERTLYIAIILAVFVIALILAYRGFRIKSKVASQLKEQKDQIENQKNVIEQKNAEVTDSINYARQLQQAILPRTELFGKYFSEYSLLYLPKDIVAGDFYFFEECVLGDTTHIIFGVADCTGHGVPGAMVSVVCSNALHRAVNEFKLTDPGKILDQVRKLVLETFEKSGGDVKDGMDISLCSMSFQVSGFKSQKDTKLKHETMKPETAATLHWAGANNPLWVIKEGEFLELKADKQPIGKFFNPKPFTTQTITLSKGSTLLLFSDGFADQFGGPKGKKFKYSNLKNLILDNSKDTLQTSNHKLHTSFTTWKGSNEQTDDVCVLAVRML